MSAQAGYGGGATDDDHGLGSASGSGGRRLRDVRAERLLSIRELAQLAGVAASTIFLIESGRSTPRISVVRRLAAALRVDPPSVSEFRRTLGARIEPR